MHDASSLARLLADWRPCMIAFRISALWWHKLLCTLLARHFTLLARHLTNQLHKSHMLPAGKSAGRLPCCCTLLILKCCSEHLSFSYFMAIDKLDSKPRRSCSRMSRSRFRRTRQLTRLPTRANPPHYDIVVQASTQPAATHIILYTPYACSKGKAEAGVPIVTTRRTLPASAVPRGHLPRAQLRLNAAL